MSAIRRFFETFDLVLGRLIALVLGTVGGFLVYFSWHIWGDTASLVMFGIGLGRLLIAGIFLYCRVTLCGVLESLAVGPSWN